MRFVMEHESSRSYPNVQSKESASLKAMIVRYKKRAGTCKQSVLYRRLEKKRKKRLSSR